MKKVRFEMGANLGLNRSNIGKEEHWPMVGELGNALEKVLIDFGRLFQTIGTVLLNERSDILRDEEEGGVA